jgi:long-subunit fatty acid transport protein
LTETRPAIIPSGRAFADSSIRHFAQIKAQQKADAEKAKTAAAMAAAARQKKDRKEASFVFSAGIGLDRSFAIGDRKNSSYNANTGSGGISDYIPHPYFKFHLNDKLYIKTEFHFSVPQFVRPIILDSTRLDSLAGIPHRTRLNLNKLFYNTIPITIHYQVFDRLSIGAGIQFSSLYGAVGQKTTTYSYGLGAGDSTYFTSIVKLKGDTTYQSFRKTDWRLLFEASYQWKKLTLGLQYQQGLSPILQTNPFGSSTDAMQAKNAGIRLYLQYDLWRQRR